MFAYQIYTVRRYENLNKSRESYVANVTHDLKSPARAQINILNMLINGDFGKLNRKQQELLELTCDSTKYMSNLVNNILTKYECDYSKKRLTYTQFNIVELVKYIISLNGWLLAEKEQKIIFKSSSEDIYIEGDKLAMERVILNLLSNASTYGFRKSNITVELSSNLDNIYFLISNYSYPLEQNDLGNLFKKFGKTKISLYNSASTGLGLYVSKRIVEMHRGKIYVKSNPNGLFTVGFCIPCNQKLGVKISV